MQNRDSISEYQIKETLPVFTKYLEAYLKKRNKTDFLVLTDFKDLVETIKRDYKGDSKVWSYHLYSKNNIFSRNYNLWLIYTSGAHPYKVLPLKEKNIIKGNVEEKLIITRPKDFNKFIKEGQDELKKMNIDIEEE